MSEHRSLFLSWWVGKRPHPNWVMLKSSQYFKSFAQGNFLFPFLHLNNKCHSFFSFFSLFFRLLFLLLFFGSIQVSGKLPTYPSHQLTLTLTSHLRQNDGLGKGQVSSFPGTKIDPFFQQMCISYIALWLVRYSVVWFSLVSCLHYYLQLMTDHVIW